MVLVQVRFRKGLFICGNCGQEDIVEWSVGGGNTYENNCSNCGVWSNSFKNYSGCLSYPKDVYDTLEEGKLETDKDSAVNAWMFAIKNPPVYVEPSIEEYEKEIDRKLEEIEEYSIKMSLIATDGKMQTINDKLIDRINNIVINAVSKEIK